MQSTCYFNAMVDTGYSQLYDAGAENGYFVKTKDGQPYNYSYIAAG